MNFWRNALWLLPAGLLALVVVMFLFGHAPGHDGRHATQAAPPPQPKHPPGTASALLGKNVETPDGELVGSIYDLVIDAHSGRVVFVLVATGGFAGIGTKLKAVPPGALSQTTAKRDTVGLNLEPHRWAKAPVVSKSRLDELEDPLREQAIYQYYQQVQLPPTGHADGNAPLHSSKNAVKTELRLAQDLIGQNVINNRNQELGRVSDLTVDLSHPAFTRAIFKSASTNGSVVALPINAFTVNGKSLLLNCIFRQSNDSLWAVDVLFENNFTALHV